MWNLEDEKLEKKILGFAEKRILRGSYVRIKKDNTRTERTT